jgi:hypothetical protein
VTACHSSCSATASDESAHDRAWPCGRASFVASDKLRWRRKEAAIGIEHGKRLAEANDRFCRANAGLTVGKILKAKTKLMKVSFKNIAEYIMIRRIAREYSQAPRHGNRRGDCVAVSVVGQRFGELLTSRVTVGQHNVLAYSLCKTWRLDDGRQARTA